MVERRRDGRAPGLDFKGRSARPVAIGGSAGLGILWSGVRSRPVRLSQVLVLSEMLEYVG